MYTDNMLYSVFIGFKTFFRLSGNFYFGSCTPIDLGYGCYRAKCDYFETGSINPFRYTSLLASSAGTLSLQNHVKIEAGLDYGFCFSRVNLTDTTINREIKFFEDDKNTEVTVKAGDKWT